VVLLPENISSERILDISEKGLAFSYRGRGMEDRIDDKAAIHLSAQSMGLANVSVRIASDHKIDSVDDGDGLRRCGLEFIGLSSDQHKLIAAIIESLF